MTPPTATPEIQPVQQQAPLPRPGAKGLGRLGFVSLVLAGTLAVAAVVLVATGVVRLWGSSQRTDIVTHAVAYESIEVTITERGSLESAENSDVVCRVKARSASNTVSTTIRWVIEDGTQVKKGERLVQLDDSGLGEQLKTQKIAVDQARALLIQADENYKIVKIQNDSDKATALLAKNLALIDLVKYEDGEYVQTRQEIKGRMEMARSDLTMWQERAAWSDRMSKPGLRFVTTAQAQADEARLKSAEIAVKKIDKELDVLVLARKRSTMEFKGKIAEADQAIKRVESQATAKLETADAERSAKRSIYEQEKTRFSDIEDEIRKCLIVAPQDGLVVYFVPEQSRFGSGSQQSIVAQGEPVREGQKLMRIPNLNKMVVATRIHEAMISRVRGERLKRNSFGDQATLGWLFADPMSNALGQLYYEGLREENKSIEFDKVSDGQPAVIRVEAFPTEALPGEVKTVATVASQQDWMSADVKVYQAMIAIKGSIPGLKPGMTAEVTIHTDSHRERVLTIPLQAILGSVDMGSKRRVYVMTPEGPRPRDVTIGLSNDVKAEVLEGLAEGDQVIRNPRAVLTDREKAALGEMKAPPGKGPPVKEKAAKAKGKGKPKE